MLQQALMSLILEKRYDAITVEDICNTANIGRSTFYSHYTSKDDLKRRGLEEHLRRLLVDRQREILTTSGDVKDRSLGFSITMFEHARDHIDMHRALLGSRGDAVVHKSICRILSDVVRNELNALDNKTNRRRSTDTIPRDLVVQYIVGAYMAVLTWWLKGGAKIPAQQIDPMFRRLVIEGITPLRS